MKNKRTKICGAGLFEFNPYEGKNIQVDNYMEPATGKNLGTKYFEVKNNPGFAPYINDFPAMSFTQWFNERPSEGNDDSYKPIYGDEKTRRAYRHEGVDISAEKGTPIKATINGIVVYSDGDLINKSYGKYLIIRAYEKCNGKTKYFLLGHLNRDMEYLKAGTKFSPNTIIAYVGNTGHCKGWDKTLQKSFDLDGINEDAEKKAARARGVGAHLHIQMFLGDWDDDDFFKLTNAKTNPNTRGVQIYNPFNYENAYFNNK